MFGKLRDCVYTCSPLAYRSALGCKRRRRCNWERATSVVIDSESHSVRHSLGTSRKPILTLPGFLIGSHGVWSEPGEACPTRPSDHWSLALNSALYRGIFVSLQNISGIHIVLT